jgi:hypothetical protein
VAHFTRCPGWERRHRVREAPQAFGEPLACACLPEEAGAEGLEIALVEVSSLLEAATVLPRPGVDQMTADLYNAVRVAMREAAGTRPERSAKELIASDTANGTGAA